VVVLVYAAVRPAHQQVIDARIDDADRDKVLSHRRYHIVGYYFARQSAEKQFRMGVPQFGNH